ncbi:ribosomal large subunit pseudouridine synthase B [bacterium BMS3Abin07]|nr:ribosomal large subunit pseudouridine synthase B [bacterium BMS3Abin07]GBE33225.1 ribosomal large subunit pseudouridine synthase B [bacterium BMS3Bbin05]HDO22761.1 rRNA pseudouridine synthase [Nitrospirota bacterium]HDZ87508.1 rRNA pseudouridine synthase [Nitrospirota bacterium]
MRERLQKIIASAGIASRRKAEELIEEGRVTVNGRVAIIGTKADPLKDHVKVDGKLITARESPVYLIFNKPVGVITTLSDPEGRPTIREYIGKVRQRVYPVGRLDYNSDGLIILTNDGVLANVIMHPKRKIPKKYLVKVRGIPDEIKLDKLRSGIRLEDGLTMPVVIKRTRLSRSGKNTWLGVTIHEGRNRQIRRMFEKIGHPVTKLRRVAIDGITLGALKPGEFRYLAEDEVGRLKKEVGIKS